MKKIIFIALYYIAVSYRFAANSDDYFQSAISLYMGNHYRNAVQNLKMVITTICPFWWRNSWPVGLDNGLQFEFFEDCLLEKDLMESLKIHFSPSPRPLPQKKRG